MGPVTPARRGNYLLSHTPGRLSRDRQREKANSGLLLRARALESAGKIGRVGRIAPPGTRFLRRRWALLPLPVEGITFYRTRMEDFPATGRGIFSARVRKSLFLDGQTEKAQKHVQIS